MTTVSGVALIAAERQRQIDEEGWVPSHDDKHGNQALAWAATCYAAPEPVYVVDTVLDAPRYGRMSWVEPWPKNWHRPDCDRIRQLVKAGALIAAEIDRLTRLAGEQS